MLRQIDNIFILDTKNTTYCFQVLPSGHLEHLYYGKKIELNGDVSSISEKTKYIYGNLNAYSKEYKNLGLENLSLEMSSLGKGDIREPFVEIIHNDGSRTCDFLYEKAIIKDYKEEMESLPSSYDENKEVEELDVILYDKNYHIKLILTYSVFENTDVITRRAKIINESKENIILERLMSTQLDFDNNDYIFSNFCGGWLREMNKYDHPCHQGKIINSTIAGTSSSRNNPFVILSEIGTTEDAGNCYGVNLIYSGNHYEAVEVNSFGKLRLISGINPETFSYNLAPKESFEAPEAVMTFSSEGHSKMSHNMHDFIRNHIVRGQWKFKERPVLLNSWEAAYFDINESKLVKMAKSAKEAGVELFVMDDGWFGKRDDDTSSLGDWYVNTKKLPGGIKRIAEKINNLGLDFGIWVEPEMVNENSDLYKAHPNWAIKIPSHPHSEGRNQMILDLSNEEVQNYIIEEMTKVFSSGNISYVKWDMNRIFSDYYSQNLRPEQQGELSHRYVVGLYRVMKELTEKFPHILFEGCSAGGNRFDLGILCFMPQIWASDNTDAICRAKIQTNYSYGYPMSTISAHVSDCPNHQTLRNTPLETRFNVAAFGILGYEFNITEVNKEELKSIKEQIEFYKKYRKTLQFGDYYRIESNKTNDYSNNIYKWMSVSADKKQALGLFLQGAVVPNYGFGKFKSKGLDDEKTYNFKNRFLQYNVKEFGDLINAVSPIHIKKDSLAHNMVAKFVKMDGETEDYRVSGSLLNNMGIRLKQNYSATGYDNEVRHFQDYSSRIYTMEEVENN